MSASHWLTIGYGMRETRTPIPEHVTLFSNTHTLAPGSRVRIRDTLARSLLEASFARRRLAVFRNATKSLAHHRGHANRTAGIAGYISPASLLCPRGPEALGSCR